MKLGQAEGDTPGQQHRQDYHLHMYLAQHMPVDLLDMLKLPYLLTYSPGQTGNWLGVRPEETMSNRHLSETYDRKF